MLLDELKQLAQNNELVSITRNCHDEELTGLLRTVSDSIVTISLFGNEGGYEGFAVFEFNQIEELYWGNREHKAIRNLVDSHVIPDFPSLNSDNFLDALKELNKTYQSVCLHSSNDEDRYEIGKIERLNKNWCKLLTFSTMKTLSRMQKIIRTDLITRVVVDSPYQNSIVSLHSTGL